MNKSHLSPADILTQIAQIQSMELGKLSEYRQAGRAKDGSPYYRLQSWQDGKNHTRHVRPEELSAVRAALAGYACFRSLTEQYAHRIVARTRDRLEQDIKKKIQPDSRHSKRKSRGSSTRS